VVAKAEELSKSYGEHVVLQNIGITIERGEKVAFVGRNGEGKTTLSRIIIGEIDYTGNLKTGHNVKTGYFAQNQDELLDENKTVFQTIDDVARGDIRSRIRDLLGAFLFRGDEIEKKVKVLSGGERSRLALVKLLLEPYNLLVLDEPTNHLDMRSKDILKQALTRYDGTLIVVSHDRDFLDGLVSKIYEFRNRSIKEHRGGIYDFLRRKKIESLKELEKKEKRVIQGEDGTEVSDNKKRYIEKKEFERNLRRLIKKVEEIETEIETTEEEIAHMDAILNNPGRITEADDEFFRKYNSLKKVLSEKMKIWEEYNHQAEEFQQTRL
jgi:ATP-binding cassette subfamily F protein 3